MDELNAEALPTKLKKVVEPNVAPAVKELTAFVVAKIDLNTVKVGFDPKPEPGLKFDVFSSGALHGSSETTGEETQTVELDRYLPRNTVHDFSVVLK